MSVARALIGGQIAGWRSHLGSARGRLQLAILVVFAAGAASALSLALQSRFHAWSAPGAVERGLWLVALAGGVATAAISMLVVLQNGFGDRAILTFTLPVPPADRFRALYAGTALQIANLWIISCAAFSFVAFPRLGSDAWPWVLLLLTAELSGVAAMVLIVIFAIRSIVGRPDRVVSLVVALAGIVAALASLRPSFAASPLAVSTGLLAALALLLGPLARPLGDVYADAFYVVQGRGPRIVKRRYMTILAASFARSRSATAALLTKELLTRGRHWANWGRVIAAVIAVAAFPFVRAQLHRLGASDSMAILGFVTAGILLAIADGASSPFGAEGNRLTLLLTAPIPLSAVVRARAGSFVVPFCATGAAAAFVLALASQFHAAEAAMIAAMAALIVAGISMLFVFGSALDVDLDLEIEGGLQGLVQEEAPLTPVRLALVATGVLLLIAELALVARLEARMAAGVLAAIDVVLLVAGWRFAESTLRHHIELRSAA